MATIKDIAVRAGVSHGTVSNVLNKKGNVSVEKINLVEKAARELGFKLNTQAKQLRQGHTKRVCVLIPGINIKRYNDLFIGLSSVLREEGYEIDLYYSSNLAHYEEELLERAVSANPAAVVVVSSFLKNPGIFKEDPRIIFVERFVKNMPENSVFVSFDFKEAGKALADRCVADRCKNVAIFCEGETFSSTKGFIDGAADTLEYGESDFRIFHADDKVGLRTAFDILTEENDFDAVITDNEENAGFLLKAHDYNPNRRLPEIYTLASKAIGLEGPVVRYELNYKLCGRKIAGYIIRSDEEETVTGNVISLDNDGFCGRDAGKQRECAGESINLLMLSSPTSRALNYLLPDFTRTTGIATRLVEASYDELYANLAEEDGGRLYDLIRLDMAWLSELGERLFLPLDLSEEPLATVRAVIPAGLSDDYYKVNGCTYALPLDASVQILYYRKDLFEDALIKREYYENSRKQLKVPESFEEFNEAARFFTKKYNPDSPTRYGTSLVFGSSVVAACDYLPRFMETGARFFDEEGRILVNTPEVRRALDNYMETYRFADQSANLWWKQATENFAQGNIAMSIVFANHASGMVQDRNSKVIGKVGFAPVPGGHPLLGGGVIGISKHSRKKAACLKFLQWVYSEKVASAITYLGGYINHISLPDNGDILELYPWIEGLEAAYGTGWRRENNGGGKNFDEFRFEKILGSAIRLAVSGMMKPSAALEEAQRRCEETFRPNISEPV